MRKYILGLGVALAFAVSAQAASFSLLVQANSYTNLFALGPNAGSVLVKNIQVTSTSNGVSTVYLYDAPTNQLTYVNPAYTNRATYATNYIYMWTNFYGVTQYATNYALITYTNSVASTTNAYRIPFVGGAAASSTVTYNGVNAYYDYGIWATNVGPSPSLITITY